MPKIDLADRLAGTRARVDAEERPAEPDEPLFARLTRKDARVREDQLADLLTLARKLMSQRRVKRERITENTLIRIAIDLLLMHQSALIGSTEEELRKSVTTELPHFRTANHRSAKADRTSSGTARALDRRSAEVPDSRTSHLHGLGR